MESGSTEIKRAVSKPLNDVMVRWNRKLTCKRSALEEPLLGLQSLLRGGPLHPG